MMRIFTYLVIIFSLFSCKKDRLKGEKEIFIGKWRWVQTKTLNNSCGGGSEYYTYKDPTTEGVNYSIEFLKCGKVVFYENGKETSKDRIVFVQFESGGISNWYNRIGWFEFIIAGDNSDENEKQIAGYIKTDTLSISSVLKWPHFIDCPCCSEYAYFIRE